MRIMPRIVMLDSGRQGGWRAGGAAIRYRRTRRGENVAGSAAAARTATTEETVAVIGGGVGGLVAAGLLAKAGRRVVLYEKNEQVYADTFELLGHSLQDHLDLQRVQPAAYRLFFGNGGGTLDMLYDVQAMVAQLEALEPGAGLQYVSWLSGATASLRIGTDSFIAQDPDSPAQLLALLLRAAPLLQYSSPADLLSSHDRVLASRFHDERIRSLLSFQDLYVGLSPFDAPGVFSLLAATELTDGVFYPRGGFATVRDSLRDIAAGHGVDIRTGVNVRCVEVCRDAVASVVLEDGQRQPAAAVVCNRDVALGYDLVQHPHAQQRRAELAGKRYSAGVIAFNWCVDRQLPTLQHHNVFISDERRRSWCRARSPTQLCARPNFYVHVPSKTDDSAAPAGCESVMVLLPVANMQEAAVDPAQPQAYDALVDAGRRAVLTALQEAGTGDLQPHIRHELVITPPDWQRRYDLEHGAAFGLSHNLLQLSIFRPGTKDERIKGLYFTGASSRPGNGVPLCMLSGRIAASRVLSDAGTPHSYAV